MGMIEEGGGRPIHSASAANPASMLRLLKGARRKRNIDEGLLLRRAKKGTFKIFLTGSNLKARLWIRKI
jgi:hypothetical protein